MNTVSISLRNGRTTEGKPVRPPRDTIDLDKLSPRARALAEAVAASLGGKAGFVWIESDGPRSTYRSDEERAAYGDRKLDDQPRRQEWGAWDKYPADSLNDPHSYLERQAAKIPAGWHVIGPTPREQVPTIDRLMTAAQVVATIERYSPETKMTPRSWRALVSKGRAPEPTARAGRTPYWDPDQVLEWLRDRPGRGARTDLHTEP